MTPTCAGARCGCAVALNALATVQLSNSGTIAFRAAPRPSAGRLCARRHVRSSSPGGRDLAREASPADRRGATSSAAATTQGTRPSPRPPGRVGYFYARTGRRPSVGRPNARKRSRRSRSFSRLIASLGGTASAQRPAPRRPPPPQAPPGPPPGARARPGPAACAPSPSRFRPLRARAAARRRSGTGGDAREGVSRDTRDR